MLRYLRPPTWQKGGGGLLSPSGRKHRKLSIRSVSDAVFRWKSVWPFCVFVVYVILGAGLLLVIEKYGNQDFIYRSPILEDCIAGHNYWAAVCYVMSAASTIGFGNVYPCTISGRVISIIYSILGIPLIVWILSNFGASLFIFLKTYYPKLKKYFQKTKIGQGKPRKVPRTELDFSSGTNHALISSTDSPTDITTLELDQLELPESVKTDSLKSPTTGTSTDIQTEFPIWIGLLLMLACIFLCALFYKMEEDYDIGESIYYSFMIYLGGDFVTKKFHIAAPMYVLIFLGFSMLSLTISTFQSNLQSFIRKIKINVLEKLRLDLQKNKDIGKADVNNIINGVFQETSAPWWLKSVIAEKDIQSLKVVVSQTVCKASVQLQTDPIVKRPKIAGFPFGCQFSGYKGVHESCQISETESAVCSPLWSPPLTESGIQTEPIKMEDKENIVNVKRRDMQAYAWITLKSERLQTDYLGIEECIMVRPEVRECQTAITGKKRNRGTQYPKPTPQQKASMPFSFSVSPRNSSVSSTPRLCQSPADTISLSQ